MNSLALDRVNPCLIGRLGAQSPLQDARSWVAKVYPHTSESGRGHDARQHAFVPLSLRPTCCEAQSKCGEREIERHFRRKLSETHGALRCTIGETQRTL